MQPGDVVLNRYRIKSLLGEGGMGAVYLVDDATLPGRQWALKEMRTEGEDDEQEKTEQFRHEAEILCRLHHANLPAVSAHFSDNDHHYLVMEFVEGQSLYDIMQARGGSVSEEDARSWGIQLCDTLSYLHGQDPPIIYRDIKPKNIMLTPEGRIKLIDFGIARLFGSQKKADTIIIGTPGFASPEQYGRGQTDPRSDLYSLGATLYNLATGLDPADTPFCFQVPSTVQPNLSNAFDNALLKALNLSPANRFQTAAEFKEALVSRQTVILPYLASPSESALALTVEPSHFIFSLPVQREITSLPLHVVNRGGRFLKARVSANRPWIHVGTSYFEGNDETIPIRVDLSKEKRALKHRGAVIIETDEQSFPVMVTVNVKPTVWDTIIPRAGVSAFLLGQAAVPLASPFTVAYTYVLLDGEEKRVHKKTSVAAMICSVLSTLHFMGYL